MVSALVQEGSVKILAVQLLLRPHFDRVSWVWSDILRIFLWISGVKFNQEDIKSTFSGAVCFFSLVSLCRDCLWVISWLVSCFYSNLWLSALHRQPIITLLPFAHLLCHSVRPSSSASPPPSFAGSSAFSQLVPACHQPLVSELHGGFSAAAAAAAALPNVLWPLNITLSSPGARVLLYSLCSSFSWLRYFLECTFINSFF